MVNRLIEYFSRFKSLNEEEKQAIAKDIKINNVKAGTTLLREGQKAFDNYFILKGCVRKYHLKDGVEHITNFYTDEDWMLPAIGQEGHSISDHYLECIEDSWLVVANEKQGSKLLKDFPQFLEISQVILEKEILKQQGRMASYQSNTPEQRYLQLLEEYPDLFQRIPQYQISSYIGVKPESLSRIRKRIVDKDSRKQ